MPNPGLEFAPVGRGKHQSSPFGNGISPREGLKENKKISIFLESIEMI